MSVEKTIFSHPAGLFVLSFTEMWERLSYYGMSAIFLLYLLDSSTVAAMGWITMETDWISKNAFSIVGWYLMFVYVTPLLGGYIADRYWGQRRSIMVGGFMMMVGKFLLATPFAWISGHEVSFLWGGIALSVLGNGFFKPNISSLVGDLYAPDDTRRDAAFTIFYMGINLGAFLAFTGIGYIGEAINFQLAFIVTGIGMLLGLVIQYFFAPKTLGDIGVHPKYKSKISSENISYRLSSEELRSIAIILGFSFLSIIFWTGFEQSTGSLTTFAKHETDLIIMGFEVPASWLRAINPFFIFLFAPLISVIWMRMGQNQPGSFIKYAIGFLILGITFLFPAIAADNILQTGEKSPIFWLILTYCIMTIAEICISPVGLSVVSSFSPARCLGVMMGVWFLCAGLGGKLSAYIGGFIVDYGYVTVFLGTSLFCFAVFIFMVISYFIYRKFFVLEDGGKLV
ncbi:MAG: peptide MFS transporter [Pseudomonadota bacterium]